jgi:SEL1 protein
MMIGYFSEFLPNKEARVRALQQWNRAAHQNNVEAQLKVGDHYYYGWGAQVDYKRAAEAYHQAEQEQSAQAMFNLGYMYEFGRGFQQVCEKGDPLTGICRQ